MAALCDIVTYAPPTSSSVVSPGGTVGVDALEFINGKSARGPSSSSTSLIFNARNRGVLMNCAKVSIWSSNKRNVNTYLGH